MSSIADFLNSDVFAVAGASRDTSKYGYQVFRALLDSGRKVYPINPNAQEIEGHLAFSSIDALPEMPQSLSVVTPPPITEKIIGQAIEAGIQNIWMQPGAESAAGSRLAREAGLNVIDDGSCLLVSLALEKHKR